MVTENIPTPPTEGVFGLDPRPYGNSSLGSHFPLKILAYKTPLFLEISNDPLWWGYGYFLEQHNPSDCKILVIKLTGPVKTGIWFALKISEYNIFC